MATKHKKSSVKRPRSTTRRRVASADARASHIVVFKRPSEANAMACQSALGLEQEAVGSRAGVMAFSANKPGGGAGKLYQRLGVASMDLDESAAEAIQSANEVDVIFPNEVRQIPRPVEDSRSASGQSEGGLGSLDYLTGLRDGIDIAIKSATQKPITLGMPAPRNDVRTLQRSWPLDLIGMSADYTAYTGLGVKVAVLDTGIDLTHPDFQGRVEEGDNAVSFVHGESVQDGNGHGTHCSGTVAGPMNTLGTRRYGVAPDVSLLVGKVLNDRGSGTDDQILDGIDWAADMGARVISMSLGSSRQPGGRVNDLYERVARNLKRSTPGVLVIAAAGNESNRPNWRAAVGNPAACASIMAVAAVDEMERVAWFSCAQLDEAGEINVAAPGVSIYSSWTGGRFRSINGTSMATPHVAGVAALYLEKDPSLSPDELWSLMESNARPLGDPSDFGYGMIMAPGSGKC